MKKAQTYIALLLALTGTWLHTPPLIAKTLRPKTILWDLGGTLVNVNKMTFVQQELGVFDSAFYFVFDAHFDKNKLEKRIFEVLTLLGGQQDGPDEHRCKHNGTCDLPKHMALWLAGLYNDPVQLIKELEAGIDQLHADKFFINRREYRLIRRAIRAMFEPEALVRHQVLIKPMVKLLEKLQARGHQLIIVSNWDAISYELFMQSACGQKLCTYFDEKNMVISGKIGINKPHPSFFEYVLHTYNLQAEECLLIDNDCANCLSAQSCGIPSFCYTGDACELEEQLIASDIL